MKRKYMTQGVLVSAILCGFSALAGEKVGNGGDAVVCRGSQKQILTIELLDHYEAREMRGMKIVEIAPEVDVIEKTIESFSKLRRLSARREQAYIADARDFLKNALFKEGVKLEDVPDSNHIALPSGPGDCGIEQVAIQRKPQFPGDKHYTINADLWKEMSTTDRVGLIRHEILFKDALSRKAANSISTRYFNSLFSSELIDQQTLRDFHEFLTYQSEWKFGLDFDIHGYRIGHRGGCEVRFFENGEVSGFCVTSGFSENFKYRVGNEEIAFSLNGYNWVEFYPSGALRSFYSLEWVRLNSGAGPVWVRGAIALNEDGSEKSAEESSSTPPR